ncbi:MAG: MFS transporter [Acidimicrobiia bacterium]|nr:MFS transporter [Acidimicrobiia bacterium]
MTLTPLHMKDGDQSNGAISLMLFSHILGMYALSPFIGRLTDRLGRYPMLLVAGVLCAGGAAWAGTTPGEQFLGLTGGQTLVGLAWSFGIIASSGLLTESFPVGQRASIQGAGDLCMAAFGALAGISAGAIVAASSYRALDVGAAGLGIILVMAVIATATSRPRPATAAPSFS